jgi:hypothetical protein
MSKLNLFDLIVTYRAMMPAGRIALATDQIAALKMETPLPAAMILYWESYRDRLEGKPPVSSDDGYLLGYNDADLYLEYLEQEQPD